MNIKQETITIQENKKENLAKLLKLHQFDEIEIKLLLQSIENFPSNNPNIRSVVFSGMGNTGRTYTTKKVLELFTCEKIVCGLIDSTAIQCNSLNEIIANINPDIPQVICIDDIQEYVEKVDSQACQSSAIEKLSRIINICQNQSNKFLILTRHLRGDLESNDQKIEFSHFFTNPSIEFKIEFIKDKMPYLKTEIIELIAKNTSGKDFVDLIGLLNNIKISGDYSYDSVKKIIWKYAGTTYEGFKIEKNTSLTLSDIIGKPHVVKVLKQITKIYSNYDKYSKYGVNLNKLIFSGPPGCGKTFAVHALAGELQFPLVTIGAENLHGRGVFDAIYSLRDMLEGQSNLIVFVDEAEKIIANQSMSEDNILLGEINKAIESKNGAPSKVILIFAVNDKTSLGTAMMDRFKEVEFPNPAYEDRLTFCKNKISGTDLNIPIEVIAKCTKDYSYRQIDRIWSDLILAHLEEDLELAEDKVQSYIKKIKIKPYHEGMFG